jgi:hypothetical protein
MSILRTLAHDSMTGFLMSQKIFHCLRSTLDDTRVVDAQLTIVLARAHDAQVTKCGAPSSTLTSLHYAASMTNTTNAHLPVLPDFIATRCKHYNPTSPYEIARPTT